MTKGGPRRRRVGSAGDFAARGGGVSAARRRTFSQRRKFRRETAAGWLGIRCVWENRKMYATLFPNRSPVLRGDGGGGGGGMPRKKENDVERERDISCKQRQLICLAEQLAAEGRALGTFVLTGDILIVEQWTI